MVTLASVFVAADDRPLRHLERDLEWLLRLISGGFVTKFAFKKYATPIVLGRSTVVSRYEINGVRQLLTPTRLFLERLL
jgi:hypothetical protein